MCNLQARRARMCTQDAIAAVTAERTRQSREKQMVRRTNQIESNRAKKDRSRKRQMVKARPASSHDFALPLRHASPHIHCANIRARGLLRFIRHPPRRSTRNIKASIEAAQEAAAARREQEIEAMKVCADLSCRMVWAAPPTAQLSTAPCNSTNRITAAKPRCRCHSTRDYRPQAKQAEGACTESSPWTTWPWTRKFSRTAGFPSYDTWRIAPTKQSGVAHLSG